MTRLDDGVPTILVQNVTPFTQDQILFLKLIWGDSLAQVIAGDIRHQCHACTPQRQATPQDATARHFEEADFESRITQQQTRATGTGIVATVDYVVTDAYEIGRDDAQYLSRRARDTVEQAHAGGHRAARADVYNSPGWKRLQTRAQSRGMAQPSEARNVVIDLDAVSAFTTGDRVFHQKFGYGAVVEIEGDKLGIAFEKAGEKKVVASFVTLASEVPF